MKDLKKFRRRWLRKEYRKTCRAAGKLASLKQKAPIIEQLADRHTYVLACAGTLRLDQVLRGKIEYVGTQGSIPLRKVEFVGTNVMSLRTQVLAEVFYKLPFAELNLLLFGG